MKVLVAGHRGMLGKAVVRALRSQSHTPLTTSFDIADEKEVNEVLQGGEPDAVINCAGKLKDASPLEMIRSNALGPHVLAKACGLRDLRLIHVSTDCVFSGVPDLNRQFYHTSDRPDAVDIYGRTKMAGETILAPNVLVVRTSFVGWGGGLLEWLRRNEGGEVEGWTQSFWNGTSVVTIAEWIAEALGDGLSGLVQVASREKVSKYQLLVEMVDLFKLNVTVKPVDTPAIDRALAPMMALLPLRSALERLRV